MKKWLLITICITMLLQAGCASAASFAPYYTYELNDFEESVAAPVGYVPSRSITAYDMGLAEPFKGLNDIYYDNNEFVYILDNGNSRVIKATTDFMVVEEFAGLTTPTGDPLEFPGAEGMTVAPGGDILIADTQNRRIIIIDPADRSVRLILRPDAALQNTGSPFDVSKVLVDRDGIIYATAATINLGIFQFTPDGEFLQFWGENEVPNTGQAMLNYLRKRFMSQVQLSGFINTTPVVVYNFDIDRNGFIYTVSPYKDENATTAQPGLLRKLNYKGQDTLDESLVFGDAEWDRKKEGSVRTSLGDVDIDENGFINLLDVARGKVFQYTDAGQLVSVFGAIGTLKGCFVAPKALESIGERIYVTDSGTLTITEFEPTEYAKTFRSAIIRMDQYDIEGSLEEWESILAMNSNSIFAYQGIGRAYDAMGDYGTAMSYFSIARAQDDYSNSLQMYMQQWLERNYGWVVAGVALLIGLLVLAGLGYRRLSMVVPGTGYSRLESKGLFPIYVLTHPADGFSQFKSRHHESMAWVVGIVAAWVLAEVYRFLCLGVPFNVNRPIDFNAPITFVRTGGVYILFCVANWGVCTLLDGKGTFKEIAATTAYALLPYVVSIYISTFISGYLLTSEEVYINMVQVIGGAWSIMLLVVGLLSIHDFTFVRTIGSLILTIVGVVVIIFFFMMFVGLLQQTWGFGTSVYKEALLRMQMR